MIDEQTECVVDSLRCEYSSPEVTFFHLPGLAPVSYISCCVSRDVRVRRVYTRKTMKKSSHGKIWVSLLVVPPARNTSYIPHTTSHHQKQALNSHALIPSTHKLCETPDQIAQAAAHTSDCRKIAAAVPDSEADCKDAVAA